MKRTYGGVKNSKAYEEVQEASVVGGQKKVVKPLKRSEMILALFIYTLVTSLIVGILLFATGLEHLLNTNHVPALVFILIIFSPTIILLMVLLAKAPKTKKRTP
jgi:phosphoglycerol transferase MdoB-like AlkP superfamily enzyme